MPPKRDIKRTPEFSEDKDGTDALDASDDEVFSPNEACCDFPDLQEEFGRGEGDKEWSHDATRKRKRERKRRTKCSVKVVKRADTNTKLSSDENKSTPKSFVCQFCNKEFKLNSHLNSHLKSHGLYEPYRCHICGYESNYKSALKSHLRAHTDARPFQCWICGVTFTANCTLNSHLKTLHPGNKTHTQLQCPHCPAKSFGNDSELKSHMTCCHTKEKIHVCDICDKHFTQANHLGWHKQSTHSEKTKVYKCSEPNCDKQFFSSSGLLCHRRYHLTVISHNSAQSVLPRNKSSSSHFQSNSKAKEGNRGASSFNCAACGKRFMYKRGLEIHSRNHTGVKDFKCDVCPKAFTRKGTLQKHKRTHSGERPYTCEVCGKGFTVSSALHRHMRIHSGEKPHRCDLCSKAFDCASNKQKHMKMHERRMEKEKEKKKKKKEKAVAKR